ncbi:Uma2 family endonuclease [Enterovirga aerilata]|uniref:Uma2 family endonuclease n=1 Tax=Enterovirga aerilata TaxID=2730920 RepID=A0A849IEN5_9HYPH|nr:Uma2 family endonuclease [Enterovirga sp. DB1703]NNM74909.1 Uma2 family endonuclease [Enterovirga sp. DB1703]
MNAHTRHLLDDAPRRLLSVADLDRMIQAGIISDDENVELIDGELIVMAAKKFSHEFVKSALVRLFNRAGSDDIFVGIEASLRLGTHNLVEPDILVCRRDRIVISPEGYIAVPPRDILLLVEVADSTLRKDRNLKARLYARHSVPDYWIVDTNARRIWRHRAPEAGRYGQVEKIEAGEAITPDSGDLAGISVRLADLS